VELYLKKAGHGRSGRLAQTLVKLPGRMLTLHGAVCRRGLAGSAGLVGLVGLAGLVELVELVGLVGLLGSAAHLLTLSRLAAAALFELHLCARFQRTVRTMGGIDN
jgi:hypothetical protein